MVGRLFTTALFGSVRMGLGTTAVGGYLAGSQWISHHAGKLKAYHGEEVFNEKYAAGEQFAQAAAGLGLAGALGGIVGSYGVSKFRGWRAGRKVSALANQKVVASHRAMVQAGSIQAPKGSRLVYPGDSPPPTPPKQSALSKMVVGTASPKGDGLLWGVGLSAGGLAAGFGLTSTAYPQSDRAPLMEAGVVGSAGATQRMNFNTAGLVQSLNDRHRRR